MSNITVLGARYSWLRRWEVYDNDLASEATVSSFICWTRHHLIAINQKAIYLGKTSESRDTRHFYGWSKTTAKPFGSQCSLSTKHRLPKDGTKLRMLCTSIGDLCCPHTSKNGVAGNRTQNLLHSVMLEEQC